VTAPVACGPVAAVIRVLLTTTTEVAGAPPSVTVAPGRNPVPVIVIGVPPAVEPDCGATPAIVGLTTAGKMQAPAPLVLLSTIGSRSCTVREWKTLLAEHPPRLWQ